MPNHMVLFLLLCLWLSELFACLLWIGTEDCAFSVLQSSETFCGDPGCMKPFASVECLRAHMRSCHQYVNCEVCGSKHLRKNYKRHLQTHDEHLPTTLKCSFEGCNHSFTTVRYFDPLFRVYFASLMD